MRELVTLFEWAAARTWADLPPRVRQRARWVLADDLAAMIAAACEPEVEAYRRLIEGRASVRDATIVAPGARPTLRYSIEGSATLGGGYRLPFSRSGEIGEGSR